MCAVISMRGAKLDAASGTCTPVRIFDAWRQVPESIRPSAIEDAIDPAMSLTRSKDGSH